MRILTALAAGCLLAGPAMAADPQSIQPQLDAATAAVTRIMVGLTQQIAADQQEIAALKAELAKATQHPAPAAPKPRAP